MSCFAPGDPFGLPDAARGDRVEATAHLPEAPAVWFQERSQRAAIDIPLEKNELAQYVHVLTLWTRRYSATSGATCFVLPLSLPLQASP
jgi:hypothetical protein